MLRSAVVQVAARARARAELSMLARAVRSPFNLLRIEEIDSKPESLVRYDGALTGDPMLGAPVRILKKPLSLSASRHPTIYRHSVQVRRNAGVASGARQ
jgi:hypothetical protein